MPVFYESIKGRPQTNYSHSQAESSMFCPHKYGLERVRGLKEADKGSNLYFGRHIETAMRHLQRTGMDPVSEFARLWEADEKAKEATYKAKWASHASYLLAGKQILKLYQATQRQMGIINPVYYTYEERVVKEGFLDDSSLEAVPDCIDWPEDHPVYGPGPRVIDIKFMGGRIDVKYEGMAKLDPQLRVYSWVTEMRRVALLAVYFGSPGPPDKGDERTLVEEVAGYSIGTKVYACDPAVNVSVPGTGDLVTDAVVEALLGKKETAKLKKDAKAAGSCWVAVPKGQAFLAPLEALANVSIRLVEGHVTKEEAEGTVSLLRDEARADAARWLRYKEILSTIPKDSMTWEEYEVATRKAMLVAYPQKPGIRFPNVKCQWCSMIGECLGRPDLSKDRLVRIGEEWIDEL